jgi:hypothetical protein
MQNPKIIGIFAGIGFVLSLLIGLFSGVKASQLFLRAFMSAVFSGLLTWGISILLLKVFENVDELEAQQGDEAQKEVLGNYVNISLGDDSLEEEDNAPHFFVNAKQMESKAPSLETFSSPKADLKDGDTFTKDEPERQQGKQAQVKKSGLEENSRFVSEAVEEKNSFQPRSLVEEAIHASKEEDTTEEAKSIAEELDDLPAISVISREMGANAEDVHELGSGTMQVERVDGAPKEDTSTIAQAIRTALAKDS